MRNILIVLCTIVCASAIAQKRDFKWYAAVPQTEVPEVYKGYDAVYIFRQISFDYMADYSTSIEFIEKVKIQSQEGLKKYNKTYISHNFYRHLTTFSARIIKPDGTVRELQKEDIVVEGVSDDRDDAHYNYAKYALKGLEVGDEVETIYIANISRVYPGADVALSSNLPSLRSVVTLTKYLDIDLNVTDNGYDLKFEQYQNESMGDVIKWEEQNVPPIKHESYDILFSEIPHMSFSPSPRSKAPGDRDYAWTDLASLINDNFKSRAFSYAEKKFLKENTDWWGQSQGFKERLLLFINFLNDIPYDELDDDTHYNLLDYLEKNKINNMGRMEMLMSFLDEEDMPYSIGFTRDKFEGRISRSLPSSHQLERYFLVARFHEEELYIFPSIYDLKIYLNEIPAIYEGNNAILIDRVGSQEMQTILFVDLPTSKSDYNFRTSRTLFKLDFDKMDIAVERKDKVSGALSYLNRWDQAYLETMEVFEELGYDTNRVVTPKIETVSQQKFFPAEAAVECSFLLHNSLRSVDNDSLYSIELADVLTLYTFSLSEHERTSYFYPIFLYKDIQSVFIQSPKAIQLLNTDELQKSVQNEFGFFHFKLSQVNPNIIKIDASIQVAQTRLEPDKVHFYGEMLKTIEELRKSRLIVSVH